ncbi:MAG TPA: hypothetical protein VMR34_05760 [Candidatus Saccharimonadales bacterium]|nr:hypothetical protein [Candidatus Saccharimonadales bacterium]
MTDYVTKTDLVTALDSGFSNIYKKLTKHFDERFDKIDQDIAGINKKYDHLITTLDAFLKRLDDIEVDNTARDAQLARLERWIEQVATKAGVKLEY